MVIRLEIMKRTVRDHHLPMMHAISIYLAIRVTPITMTVLKCRTPHLICSVTRTHVLNVARICVPMCGMSDTRIIGVSGVSSNYNSYVYHYHY